MVASHWGELVDWSTLQGVKTAHYFLMALICLPVMWLLWGTIKVFWCLLHPCADYPASGLDASSYWHVNQWVDICISFLFPDLQRQVGQIHLFSMLSFPAAVIIYLLRVVKNVIAKLPLEGLPLMHSRLYRSTITVGIHMKWRAVPTTTFSGMPKIWALREEGDTWQLYTLPVEGRRRGPCATRHFALLCTGSWALLSSSCFG